ncbi:chemotaxis protein CheD [Formivibrio citricus]|uniref:Probable chemoreceptor glutamine deamidase CheD n=1 Tax=Formivibrio citricus TaxID=83765 RepID=A0A1I4VCP5_9NEIS|nr:hypothetical protein [Formivibrio citricus]SFM98942.1 chemotaxis protein CheD [Formivibrio citricus]
MMSPTSGKSPDKFHPSPPLVNLMPGECGVSKGEQAFVTLLGSCVAVCIHDKLHGIGGMNHFLLPAGGSIDPMQAAWDKTARYGDYAMELLINRAMALGAERRHLVAKVFGGAAMLSNVASTVGARNAEFALNYLHVENIPITAQDLGGACARKVCFYPDSGKVVLRRIKTTSQTLLVREQAFAKKIQEDDAQGEIIFF